MQEIKSAILCISTQVISNDRYHCWFLMIFKKLMYESILMQLRKKNIFAPLFFMVSKVAFLQSSFSPKQCITGLPGAFNDELPVQELSINDSMNSCLFEFSWMTSFVWGMTDFCDHWRKHCLCWTDGWG